MIDLVVSCTAEYTGHLERMLSSVPKGIPVYVAAPEKTELPSRVTSVPLSTPFTRGIYLNRAARKATATYLLIADSDFYFDPRYFDFLATYIKHIKRNGTYATSYVYFVPKEEVHFLKPELIRPYGLKSGQLMPTQNPLLIGREYFLDVLGGYDERMFGWGAEDDDLQRRADRSGLTQVRLPLVVFHQHHGPSDKSGRARNIGLMQENDSQGVVRANTFWELQDKIWLKDRFLSTPKEGLKRPSRIATRELIAELKPPTVLDVGCGTGVERENLHGLTSYVGVDFSHKMVEICREKFPGTTFHRAPADKLPFRANTFDLVLIRHLLEHLEHGYERAVTETLRVSRKYVLILFFNPLSDSPKDKLLMTMQKGSAPAMAPLNTYSRQKWFSFLQKFSGWKIARNFQVSDPSDSFYSDDIFLLEKTT